MRVLFTKMHGLGNDFVVLDARQRKLPEIDAAMAARLAHRRTGIGCDQLILLEPSTDGDFRMRIFNSDGGEVEACGNAARAVALMHGSPAQVETDGGMIFVEPGDGGAKVDMGKPVFEWNRIPLAYAMDTMALPVAWDALENPAAVNVGNPHAVFFVDDCDAVPLETLGPRVENDELFPERINVNVATIQGDGSIRLKVWERGAGLTRACGTGACATAVTAARLGLADRDVTVHLPGGELQILWDAGDNIIMTGPACESYQGSFVWEGFA